MATKSEANRYLHDNPIERLKKQDEEARRNSPRGKLKEKHAAEVQSLQREHAGFARDQRVEESEIRRRAPANDEFRVGTIQRKRLDEMKAEREKLNAVFGREMAELEERHQKELERLDRRGSL